MKLKSFTVYVIHNTENDKVYIGVTSLLLKDRLSGHFSAAKKGVKSPLCSDIRKIGRNKFNISKIENVICHANYEANRLENKWILYYKSIAPNGYNISNKKELKNEYKKTMVGFNIDGYRPVQYKEIHTLICEEVKNKDDVYGIEICLKIGYKTLKPIRDIIINKEQVSTDKLLSLVMDKLNIKGMIAWQGGIKFYYLKTNSKMKIIKPAPAEKAVKVKCYKCKTVFAYVKSDVQFDSRERNSYVVCPNEKCKAFIGVTPKV